MSVRSSLILFILFFLAVSCSQDNAKENQIASTKKSEQSFKIIWHWVDDFAENEQEKLKDWLRVITKVTKQTIGIYQFDVHYYFYRSNGNEPVPFAHTRRSGNKQSVHFYVNPKYTLQEFVGDWTAQHEISHLSIPFVGKKNMWFSEGYATYLSRKIMITQDIYTSDEFDSLYYNRIGGDKYIFNYGELTIPRLCDKLKKAHHYPAIYYAGCSYFYRIDKLLIDSHHTELIDVVAKYQKQNRLLDQGLSDVIKSFDEIVGSPVFSELFFDYSNNPSSQTLSYFKK